MRPKQSVFQFDPSNYNFIITPQRLLFDHRVTGIYLIELQKGCKSIKTLNEYAQFHNNKEYTFRRAQPIIVKAFKEKNMNYCFSIYKNVEDKLEIVEVLKFDLNARYTAYIEELKSQSFLYAQLLKKQTYHELISQSWMSIKQQMKSIKNEEVLKDSRNIVSLEFLIQIKSNFDYAAEQEIIKSRVLKKGSHESEGNISSVNSLKTKNKQTNTSPKTSKNHSSLDRQTIHQKSNTSLEIQNESNSQNVRSEGVLPLHSRQEQGIMYMPIPQLRTRNQAPLSDIVQASMEESSPNVGDKTDRKTSEISITPDHVNNSRILYKTKTFHFGHSVPDRSELKRNNSLSSIKNGLKVEDQDEENIKQAEMQEEFNKQIDELTNESTVVKQNQVFFQQQTSEKVTFKYLLFVIILFGAFSILAISLTPTLQKTIKINEKNFRKQFKPPRKFINLKRTFQFKKIF